MQETTPS